MKETKDTMEALCSRLDALQEQQMKLIETDDGDLQNVLLYFGYLRKETMLLYAANERGHKKVGFTMVPNKKACEANAKKCIRMHLAVSSLLSSLFAKEKWFLSQVSYEMFQTPPVETFKKEGRTVTVTFDNDDQNNMEYVCWTRIYCQMSNGGWGCFCAVVCYEGIYYDVEGERRFYVDFLSEAQKYGTGEQWTVLFDGKAITDCTLVSSTSTTSPTSALGYPILSSTPGNPGGEPAHTKRRRKPQTRRLLGPPPSPPPSPPPGRPPPPRPPTPPPRPPATPPSPLATAVSAKRHRETSAAAGAEGRGGSGDSCGGFSDCDCNRDSGKRLRADPLIPCLLIAGGANQVKCLRHRLKVQFFGLYSNCSTTWSWVGHSGSAPNHRICVSFSSEEQRNVFLNLVPLPGTVTVAPAELPF
ncbi:E2 [Tursiops truncatus papillomavirus 3]|uniref:Regulatory protein E2 n=1 Tax=Tursiops truncatus papillomavirus type 3 TaxID=496865 RepID=B4XYE9_9PAPI|nr:E2 [Tursiops truncatus papillomavirus type 3]